MVEQGEKPLDMVHFPVGVWRIHTVIGNEA